MKLLISWNSLWTNKQRTIFIIILISLAFASTVVFNGYTTYMINGMEMGYVEKTGSFQIANTGYFDNKYDSLLGADDIKRIRKILEKDDRIYEVTEILLFSGLIGDSDTSTPFIATATNNPLSRFGSSDGMPITHDDDILLGSKLAKNLNIYEKIVQQNDDISVNIMASLAGSGLSFSSFNVSGTYDSGTTEIDSRHVIMKLDTALNMLSLNECASYIEVKLLNNKDLKPVIANISEMLDGQFEVKDWKQLNPSYAQVSGMFNTIQTFFCIIMYFFIFVALSFSLNTEFTERLNEFGTLKAIGASKETLITIILYEVIMIISISLLIGYGEAQLIRYLSSICDWQFIPPGEEIGYKLVLIFNKTSILLSACFIIIVCMLSSIAPICKTIKYSPDKLMHS